MAFRTGMRQSPALFANQHRDRIVLRPRGSGDLATLVQRVPDLRIRPQAARIAIKDRGRILFINPADVLAIVAQGNYVLLQLESGSYCLRGPISAMAVKLGPYGFVRIHRSVLVNRAWVEEVRPDFAGEQVLRLKSGKEFTVSRTYRKNLRSLAELWLGKESFPGR